MSPVFLVALATLLTQTELFPDEGSIGAVPVSGATGAMDDVFGEEAEFMLQLAEEDISDRRLQLYGFSDLTYIDYLMGVDNPNRIVVERNSTFLVASLNLYISAELGPSFRSLSEIRFLYSTARDLDSSSLDIGWEPTTIRDYGDDFTRDVQVGFIEIERSWGEYILRDWFRLRFGQWLTPYGIWNVDHGAPTVITVRRPYTIGEQLFPERQTGVQLLGTLLLGSGTLGYHITVSNGRGEITNVQDLDDNKALGGRVYFETREFGDLTVGLSGYMGKATDRTLTVELGGAGEPARVSTDPDLQFDERSLGADLRWDFEGFHVVFEYVQNEADFSERGRPTTAEFYPYAGQTGVRAADFRRWGLYGLVGYRIAPIGLMPYVLIERVDYGLSNPAETVDGNYFGLNWQVNPYVVAKLELTRAEISGGVANDLLEGEDFWSLAGQVAWSF